MIAQHNIHSIHYKSVTIQYRQFVLHLHRNFTTAHSTSATRTNFFVRVGSKRPEIQMKMYGYGQCGLPPKKPGCYMSDINDCFQFLQQLKKRIEKVNNQNQKLPSSSDISIILSPLQSSLKEEIVEILLILQEYGQTQHFRAPKCCLEFGLMDLLTQYHQTTIGRLIFPSSWQGHKCYSFYTASLECNDNMLENAKSHLQVTKYLKFKYNNNIKGLLELLLSVHQQGIGNKIIVDANCSWGVQQFQQLLQGLAAQQFQGLANKILYIQQPFDLEISNQEKWAQIKNKSPIKILADESFRNEKDIEKVKKVAHAVNIKTEKTGGVFATLRAASEARKAGLEVMFGSMCSTQLGCTQVFQFHPMAQFLDIDGALLVKQPQIQGGFSWQQDGRVEVWEKGFGLQVDSAKLFE